MKKLVWVLLLCFLFPVTATAATEVGMVPCVQKMETGWRMSLSKRCRQLTEDQVRANNKRLLRLKFYQKQEVEWTKSEQTYEKRREALQKEAALRESQLKKTQEHLKAEVLAREKWQKAYGDLKKERLPPRHWTQSPAFWFGVGFLTASAIAGATVAVVIAVRK